MYKFLANDKVLKCKNMYKIIANIYKFIVNDKVHKSKKLY